MRKAEKHRMKDSVLSGYSQVSVIESDYQIGGEKMNITRIDAETLALAELWADINETTVQHELQIELQLAE